MDITFDDCTQNIEKYGVLYAKYQSLSWHLQEMRKVILNEEKKKFIDLPEWKAEAEARTCEVYKKHLDGTREAMHLALNAKAKMLRWTSEFEKLRSLNSKTKREMEYL